MDSVGYFFNVLVFVVLFFSILFIAFLTTKFLAKKGREQLQGKNLKVIESLNIGIDMRIHLLKVGEDYLLISTSGKSISFMTKVEDKFEEFEEIETNKSSFKSIIEKYDKSVLNMFNKKNNSNDKTKIRGNVDSIGEMTESLKNNEIFKDEYL